MRGVKASVSAIGAAYAEMEELKPKHGIKQVDRFLSNKGIDVTALTPGWGRFVLGGREEVMALIEEKRVAQMGTFNGNPLTIAAAKVTLEEIRRAGHDEPVRAS